MKLFLLLCIPILCTQVSAQEKKKPRTCRVIYIQKPVDAPSKAYLYDGKSSQEVILPALNLSEVIKIQGGEITIGFSPTPVIEGEEFPRGAPKVKIPGNYSDIYLLLSSDPKNKVLPFEIKVISIDGMDLKKGQTLWINTTRYQMAAKTGNTKFTIPPAKLTVSNAPLRDHGFYLAQFAYREDTQKPFLPVMKKNWWFDANSRHLGFIIDTGARMPRIYTMRDRRPPKPPKDN